MEKFGRFIYSYKEYIALNISGYLVKFCGQFCV